MGTYKYDLIMAHCKSAIYNFTIFSAAPLSSHEMTSGRHGVLMLVVEDSWRQPIRYRWNIRCKLWMAVRKNLGTFLLRCSLFS